MKQQLLQEKRSIKGEHIDVFPEYGRSDEENVTEAADREDRVASSSAASSRLEEVQAALDRIESNTYGITEDGEVIPEERLRANPAATTIIS